MSNDPLLGYSAATNPSPLQAADDPENGTKACVNISILPGSQTIYSDMIAVRVPINRQSGTAYFTENPGAAVNVNSWNAVAVKEAAGDELIPSDPDHHVIYFYNRNVDDLVTFPLVFSISGKIAATPGDPLVFQVVERSGTEKNKLTKKNARTLTMSVVEPVFFLRNFLSRSPYQATTVPRTRINAGDPIQLSWESNGGYFYLYDGINDDPVYSGTGTSWFDSDYKISNDTTFVLMASAADSAPAADSGQQASDDFKSVELYASITVTVNNPTLTGLTVSGQVTAESGLTVNGSLDVGEEATIREGLTVQDGLTVGYGLTVSGTVHAKAGLDVDDTLTAGDLVVGEKLSTEGHDGLEVKRSLWVDGSLTGYNGAEFVADNGTYVRIRELRGPLSERLTVNSTTQIIEGNDMYVADDLSVAGSVSVEGKVSVAGNKVVAAGDAVLLRNEHKGAYLTASDIDYDDDWSFVFVRKSGEHYRGASFDIYHG